MVSSAVPFHDLLIDWNWQALLRRGAKSRAKRTKRLPRLPRSPRLQFRPEATLVEVEAVVVGAVVQDVVGLSPGVAGVLLEAVQTVILPAQTCPSPMVLPLAPRIPQSLQPRTRRSSLSQSRSTPPGRRPLPSQRIPHLYP